MSADDDGVRWRPVTDGCAGQYPNPILGPTFEFVQRDGRVVEADHHRFGVASPGLDDLKFVVDDAPVGPFGWRRFPGHADRSWRHCFAGDVLWRRSGNYLGSDLTSHFRPSEGTLHHPFIRIHSGLILVL